MFAPGYELTDEISNEFHGYCAQRVPFVWFCKGELKIVSVLRCVCIPFHCLSIIFSCYSPEIPIVVISGVPKGKPRDHSLCINIILNARSNTDRISLRAALQVYGLFRLEISFSKLEILIPHELNINLMHIFFFFNYHWIMEILFFVQFSISMYLIFPLQWGKKIQNFIKFASSIQKLIDSLFFVISI